MATDNEATAILAELRATLDQLERAGVQVRVTQRGDVLWIGVLGAHLVRGGQIEHDAAAALAAEVGAAQNECSSATVW